VRVRQPPRLARRDQLELLGGERLRLDLLRQLETDDRDRPGSVLPAEATRETVPIGFT
jgi:hypothetical protein